MENSPLALSTTSTKPIAKSSGCSTFKTSRRVSSMSLSRPRAPIYSTVLHRDCRAVQAFSGSKVCSLIHRPYISSSWKSTLAQTRLTSILRRVAQESFGGSLKMKSYMHSPEKQAHSSGHLRRTHKACPTLALTTEMAAAFMSCRWISQMDKARSHCWMAMLISAICPPI